MAETKRSPNRLIDSGIVIAILSNKGSSLLIPMVMNVIENNRNKNSIPPAIPK